MRSYSSARRSSSAAGGDLNGALSAFSQQLASVPAESEEDATPRAAAKAADASPKPFLTSAWPAERAQQRAFLAQTAASWMLIAVVLAAHVQLLSAMGHVEAVFVALSPWSPTAQVFILFGGLTCVAAYVADISFLILPLRLLVAAAAFAFFGFGVYFNAHTQPVSPHVFMVLALPFLQAVLKMFFLPNAPLLNFLRALAYGFALAGAVVVAFFIGWLCSDESHAFSVKVPALCTDLQLKPASSNCLGAILSWAAPALAGGWSIMLAGISFFISRSHEESGLAAASKLLPVALLSSLLCSWVAAQIGAVQMPLADALQVFGGAGLISTGIISCVVLGWERFTAHPVLLNTLASTSGDWLRAFLVSFIGLMYLVFLPISALNQFIRKLGPLAHFAEVPEEHRRFSMFTPAVAKQLHAIEHWNWSSVAPKTMRVGLAFICIIVGLQKLLTLFFVWFIAVVAYTPPAATVGIYILTGTGLLFFIPWMAGVPLYLAGGVVITAAFKELVGFGGALGIAVVVTTATKAIAVFALHRFLGAVWMKDAALRREFELTSVHMRAMEMILSRPGADVAKLCMLVAGPDWLTSVLAGMHNTNVWRILGAQMAPTTLLIAGPATMAGAFQLRVPEGGSWSAASSLLLIWAAACQGIGIVLFCYQINATSKKHREELKDKPSDREVEELLEIFEKTEAPVLKALDERIHWQTGTPSRSLRFMLIAGTVALCLACTVVRYSGSMCFMELQINDSVVCETAEQAHNPRRLQTRKCLNGHAERLVGTAGWGVLFLSFFGFACYRGFLYSCHRIKVNLKTSSAVHPMLTAAAAAEAEEGVLSADVPAALKGRPRGRAANRSTLEQALSAATTAHGNS